jgi:hypothetical protein
MNIHNLTEAQKEANRQAVYRENAEWLAAHPTTDEDRAIWELEFKLMKANEKEGKGAFVRFCIYGTISTFFALSSISFFLKIIPVLFFLACACNEVLIMGRGRTLFEGNYLWQRKCDDEMKCE